MKYKLGEEVLVDFMGTITKAELKEGEVRYLVIGTNAWAIDLKESEVLPLLPEPKIEKKT